VSPANLVVLLGVTPVTPVSRTERWLSPEMEKYRSRSDRDCIRRTRAYVLLSEPGSLSEREILQTHHCPTVAPCRVIEAVQLSRKHPTMTIGFTASKKVLSTRRELPPPSMKKAGFGPAFGFA
jgi:hypothetical protein